MNEPFCASSVEVLPEPQPTAPDSGLHAELWAILGKLCPRRLAPERRRWTRYPFPYLILLTPVEDDDLTPAGSPIVVVGKHLSECGMDFYHPQPLPHRRMVASLEKPDGTWLSLVVDINRCRFTREGWYESGCRFLQLVDWPIETLR
jgi:hypothetical protein